MPHNKLSAHIRSISVSINSQPEKIPNNENFQKKWILNLRNSVQILAPKFWKKKRLHPKTKHPTCMFRKIQDMLRACSSFAWANEPIRICMRKHKDCIWILRASKHMSGFEFNVKKSSLILKISKIYQEQQCMKQKFISRCSEVK